MSDVQIAVIDQQDTQIVLAVPGVQGATGSSIPSGGTAEQVLRKNSSTDYDANWTQVTSAMIADGTIVNADINASAAIAGTKISPDFGSQTVQTTGIFSAAGGSAAAPSIAFTGDTNTGIYSPGADQVAISTGGSGRLFVDASGNVGVGGAPTFIFDTTQSVAAGYTSWGFRNTAVDGYAQQQFIIGPSGANGTASINYAPGVFFAIGPVANDTTTPIVFRNNNAQERLRITSAGLVGVGTSLPGSKLHVAGGATVVSIGSNDAGDTGAAIFYGTGTKYNWKIGAQQNVDNAFEITPSTAAGGTTFTTPLLVINSAGNVGIGTTSPSYLLDVAGSARIKTGATGTPFVVSSGGDSQGSLRFGSSGFFYGIYGGPDYLSLQFHADGAERARIDSSGRLLVGTSSGSGANTLFESSSTTANAANIALVKQNSGTADQAGQQLHFYNFGPAGTGRAADTEVGSMRFYGSQPTSGAAQEMARITCAADLLQTGTNTSGRLVFSVTADGASSPTERMRIKSNGTINFSNVAVYADNAAATTGGLVAGDIYRKADGTLMITF